MHHFRRGVVGTPLALFVALVTAVTLSIVSGSAATTTTTTDTAASARPVAHNNQGSLESTIRGSTDDGRRVTGSFVPLRFVKKNGHLKVRGLLQGVVHNEDNSTSTFGVMRTMRVKSVNGESLSKADAGAMSASAPCDILHLVLGPLDLNLLGLQINLNRVVLDIVAIPGPGNLLGNLLCAVAGLLDGGLDGLLGRIVRLLNRILGRLGLGL